MVGPILPGRNSKFKRFDSWFRSVQSILPVRAGCEVSIFPCALPYPEVLEVPKGTICGTEEGSIWWAKSLLNAFVSWSNYICLGCPDCDGSVHEPRACYRSCADARQFADQQLGEIINFGSPSFLSGKVICEGKRRSTDEMLDHLRSTMEGYQLPKDACGPSEVSGALPVVADRIAIPEEAGLVDLVEWLPEGQREVVENLEQLQLPECLWDEVVVACHRVPKSEESDLVKRLLKSKMVTLVPEHQLPKRRSGDLLCGGFFCVAKNEVEDRLIYDRRPCNSTMSRIKWGTLPSAACYTKMLLRDDEYLRGSGDDLRNYYYSLKLPDNWVRFNAVGRRVDPKLVKLSGGNPAVPHRMCMRVLGMGDRNACDLAQAVHTHILQSNGILQTQNTLAYGEPVPEEDLWEGIYLDDLLITFRHRIDRPIPLDGTFVPPEPAGSDPDVKHVRQAEEAYVQAGLSRAEHKAFRQQVLFKAWGASIDGVRGTIGVPLEVRQQVWLLLQRIIFEGFSAGKILQKVLGYICFIFQFRRELFSLLHHVYKYLRGCPEHDWRRLPPYVLDELRSVCLHLPFAFWNMRKKLSSSLLATDATPSSAGAVRAQIPDSLARAFWRLAEMKGEAVRMDSQNDLLDADVAPKEPSVFASRVSESLDWKVTASYSFRNTSHINLQEGRALKQQIQQFCSDVRNSGLIQISLNDSRVVIGAFSKGRSSSFRLNGILRSMLPFLVFSDVCLALLWVETKSNIADYPSRFAALPIPRAPPRWMEKLGVSRVLKPGLEIFAGSARLTRCHLAAGVPMLDPIDILYGCDAMDKRIDELIRQGRVGWIWLAPPCSSFSPLRNLDVGGPLRPSNNPEGNLEIPEVALGNKLWNRAIVLACLAMKAGVPFTIEHPKGSRAWLLRGSQKLLSSRMTSLVVAHWCMYCDKDREGAPNKKPTRLLTSMPWLPNIARICDGSHVHGAPLRGKRAKAASAYPWEFCELLAEACASWTHA